MAGDSRRIDRRAFLAVATATITLPACTPLFGGGKMTPKLTSPYRGLHATPPAPLPFLDGVVVRSFVLEREQGNIIVYHSPGVSEGADEIRRLGRPEKLLVNHWHEAMYEPPTFDVPIFVHERDRGQTKLPIAGTFSDREMMGDDLELIPTPGHTPGTTMFVWDNGEHRMLFSGDSVWVQGGEWRAVLLNESDRADYIASLKLLREVDFDVLVPWGAEDDQPVVYPVKPQQARQNLDAIIARLEAGENG